MVACALTGEELEEEAELEETDEEEEEVSVLVCVYVFCLKTRSDRIANRFSIFVSGVNVGCWFILVVGDILAFFFFLPPGGEKESTDGGSAFLLGRQGKSTRESVMREMLADFIEAALNGLCSNISAHFLQIDE